MSAKVHRELSQICSDPLGDGRPDDMELSALPCHREGWVPAVSHSSQMILFQTLQE